MENPRHKLRNLFSIEHLRLLTVIMIIASTLVGLYAGWYDIRVFKPFLPNIGHIVVSSMLIVTPLWVLMAIFVFFKRYFLAALMMLLYYIDVPSEFTGTFAVLTHGCTWDMPVICTTSKFFAVTDLLIIILLLTLIIWQLKEVSAKKRQEPTKQKQLYS